MRAGDFSGSFNEMNGKRERVLVAMSGGVDSSAAAIILKKNGFEPIGVTMKLFEPDRDNGNYVPKGCCSTESIYDARYVCSKIGIPHYTLDLSSEFKAKVINNFVDEYLAGRTPNPCIKCNTYLKWGALIEFADKMGINFIATGHYARITALNGGKEFVLLKAKHTSKDQSYALWGIKRELLARTLFPLGELSKTETRRLLEEEGVSFFDKGESQEICFIPDNDLESYLREQAFRRGEDIRKGAILSEKAELMGEHKGLPFYTIGQRKGLGISHPKPLYVKGMDKKRNVLIVAENKSLLSKSCLVEGINWLIDEPPTGEDIAFEVKIRYRHKPSMAKCRILDKGLVGVVFDLPQRAITPGQSAVFYNGDRLCGGGIIIAP